VGHLASVAPSSYTAAERLASQPEFAGALTVPLLREAAIIWWWRQLGCRHLRGGHRPPRIDMKMMRRILKATCVTGLLGLALAPGAVAGKYHVYACRTPSGASAPADGWTGSVAAGGAHDDYAKNTCTEGGALIAALGDQTIHIAGLDQATWTFSVPAGETMAGATLWRAGDADGGAAINATYAFWLAGPNETSVFDECVYVASCISGKGLMRRPLAAENRVVVPVANLGSSLYVRASCEGVAEYKCPEGKGDANGYAAVVDVYAADILFEQSGGPVAKEVSGPLATEKIVQGTSDLVFNASDPGAGVWETLFSVDGRVVQSTVPNEYGGHCKNLGQTTDGLPAFLYLQPCPQTEGVDVGFDTTTVPNGIHHLVVSVLDAAGNPAPVLDREIDVENPGPAAPARPGRTLKRGVTRRRARLTLRVEPHKVRLRQSIHFQGRLLGGHIPKMGKLLVLEARQGRGRWLKFSEVRAGAHGRYHGSYRFEFLGLGRWEIRVVCEGEAGYSFATGWSRVVRVRVV
jgi:hypothetical protein